jgi:hypothetical protein
MRSVLVAVVLSIAAPAFAHVGGVVANANFTSPAPAPTSPVDGGVVLQSGYSFATADQSFNIAWTDGDIDPTGHFFFYYWDHMPTFGVTVDNIEQMASKVTEVGNPGVQVAIYVACTCSDDAGVVCADFSGGLVRDCRNAFNWDTSQVPNGVYWIQAVNYDPPFHVYQVAQAPVVVSHGGAAPPGSLVLVPDGYGTWDKSYRIQWYGQGTAPLHFDLAWGDEMSPFGTLTPLGNDVTPIVNPDGTYGFDWDISGLASLGSFFVRVTTHDANGVTTFTDSRFSVSIFHPDTDGGGGTPLDMSMTPPPKSGCSVELGAGAASSAVPLALIVLTVLVAARFARRRS